ncbi:MAG: hypothetical protein K6F83_05545 [Clostridiales bacterium]|nr:hypothetical protein [Clostridiales bacterium]
MEDCLVYFFTGFLDSGKTSVICSWTDGERFRDSRIVIIATEEGEEEYIKDNYPNADPVVITCDTDDMNGDFTNDIEKKYKPDIIFIEWNGSVSPSEFFEKCDVPERWALAASIVVIDASTYTEYFKNMQSLFADYFRYADTVIFNRVSKEGDNIPRLRSTVKSVNPGISVNFLDEDNTVINIEDHLPYNLDDDPCVITDENYGLFYTDALDNVKRYNGKRVTLIGKALIFREIRGRAFALSRRAYTCCSDDIGQINLLCFLNYGSNFPAGEWLKVTGQVRYYEDESQGKKMAVPCIVVDDYVVTGAPENDIIYFG